MTVFIKSFFIGMFAIFPGISGSALAVSLELYDKVFFSLRNIKQNKLFILLFFTGLIFGVIIGSNIIIYLTGLKNILYYIFIGLITSDIPFMIRRIKKVGKLKHLPLLCSFMVSLVTLLFCKNIFNKEVSFIKMVFGGILFSFGKIFPGVSSSFFLIILGIYEKIIICFGNPTLLFSNFLYYLPFILGVIFGLLIFIKLLNYLLMNKYDLLYSVLVGFVLSSIISIFPKFEISLDCIIGIILMLFSFAISYRFHIKKDI